MNFDLDIERLRGRRLFVGTPMYDGKCYSEYTFSSIQLTALCTQIGVDLRFYFACRDALITKARDHTVDEFLKSGDDNFIFIDSDVGFDARDVIRMLAMQAVGDRSGSFDVIAAPYPLKHLSWQRVLAAAKAGLADDDPELLARYSSAISVHPADDIPFSIHDPIEVTQAGTGFMMIKRETFEALRQRHPSNVYTHKFRDTGQTSSSIHAFFETEIDSKHGKIEQEIRDFIERHPLSTAKDILAFIDGDEAMRAHSGTFVSEDYAFCRRTRDAGMKVWLCPWIELTHRGSHNFNSRLVDLSAIGAL